MIFSSRRRHTRYWRDWSSDVCSSDLREALYLTGTAEIAHFAEELDASCHGACGHLAGLLHSLKILNGHLCTVFQTGIGHAGDVGHVDIVGNAEGRLAVVSGKKHFTIGRSEERRVG